MCDKLMRAKLMTLQLLLLLLTCCTWHVAGQTNNTVNGTTGSIVWGQLAPDKPYKTVGYKADDAGLDPYYALAHSFIDTSLPEELPVVTVKGLLDGTATIGDKWQKLAKDFVGFALCIVIGLLFIIIFPIVGCCFCCCRCCGNCGGKRHHEQSDQDNCKRIGFSIALGILSLFVITGAACTFVSSDQFHNHLDGLNSSFGDAVVDFNTFIDNIDSQFHRLGDDNFNFLSGVLSTYVANASSDVSASIITAINKEVNLDADLDKLDKQRAAALTLVEKLSNDAKILSTQKTTAASKLPTTAAQKLNAVDFTPIGTAIDDFKVKVSTDVFRKMQTDINNAIENEVTKATQGIDVDQKLKDIHSQQITPMLGKLSTLRNSLNSNADDYQTKVEDMVDFVKKYDQYRWYGGLGLACLLTLIALMMIVGLVLGGCCSRAHTPPAERGSASNCGGILLMASVGLVFIFGALLMLMTTVMFMTGALTERYVCQSLKDLHKVEKYTSTLDLGLPDLKNMSFSLNGQTISVSVSAVMDGCKEGKTLYEVMDLEGVINTALGKIEDFKNASLSSLNTIDAAKAASTANGAVDVSNQINSLKASVTSLGNVQTSIQDLKTKLQKQQQDANTLSPGSGDVFNLMITTLTSMETTTVSLQSQAQQIVTSANALNAKIPAAMTKLNNQTFMKNLIQQVTSGFSDEVFGFVDSYINDMKSKLAHDIAKCTPFYSITNAILAEAFCHGIVDPLNGFWLALGWCIFFFMPSLILAVKLAKHFRTMDTQDSYDSSVKQAPGDFQLHNMPAPSVPPKSSIFPPINGAHNKVSPF